MAIQHVPGKKAGNIMLYALSTCGWCAKTKKLLDELGVEYSYEYVDLLQGADRATAIGEVMKWNPKSSFPVMVIDDAKIIIGFQEDDIREALRK